MVEIEAEGRERVERADNVPTSASTVMLSAMKFIYMVQKLVFFIDRNKRNDKRGVFLRTCTSMTAMASSKGGLSVPCTTMGLR